MKIIYCATISSILQKSTEETTEVSCKMTTPIPQSFPVTNTPKLETRSHNRKQKASHVTVRPTSPMILCSSHHLCFKAGLVSAWYWIVNSRFSWIKQWQSLEVCGCKMLMRLWRTLKQEVVETLIGKLMEWNSNKSEFIVMVAHVTRHTMMRHRTSSY